MLSPTIQSVYNIRYQDILEILKDPTHHVHRGLDEVQFGSTADVKFAGSNARAKCSDGHSDRSAASVEPVLGIQMKLKMTFSVSGNHESNI